MPMPSNDHEETDTRMCVHIKDSLEKGARVISVRTVDTDVIIIIAAIFHQLRSTYPGVEIWVAFGVGKHFRYLHINKICQNLGASLCQPFTRNTSLKSTETRDELLITLYLQSEIKVL